MVQSYAQTQIVSVAKPYARAGGESNSVTIPQSFALKPAICRVAAAASYSVAHSSGCNSKV